MYTVLTMLALSLGNVPAAPAWHDDYAAALKQVQGAKKPLAVFLGSGKDGWKKVIQEGTLSPELARMLSDKFVCLFVDTDTEAGKRLQTRFDLAARGLVISDAIASTQAFSLSGSLTQVELTEKLTKYSDATKTHATTETVIRETPPSYFAQPSCPNGNCPNVRR